MADVPLMYDDPRPIKSVWLDGDGEGYLLWQNGCEKIVCYKEHGQMDFVPYIAVYENGQLKRRFPAAMCIVTYQ